MPPHPILFIRYEKFFENVRTLQSFINLPEEFVSTFPLEKKRSSSLELVSPQIRNGLHRLYGSFAAELDQLDDVQILKKGGEIPRISTYFSLSYLYAFLRYETIYFLKQYLPWN